MNIHSKQVEYTANLDCCCEAGQSSYGCLYMWGAYYRDGHVIVPLGTYIHRVLILYGC